jgi:Sugar phosphate isomerases/epimerases
VRKEICYSDLPLLTQDVERNVEALIAHGADIVELLLDGIQWDDMQEKMRSIVGVLRKFDVGFSIHPPAWDTNLTSENRTIREATFEEYRKAIEFAHELEAEHVVIHPGFAFSPAFDKSIARQRAQEYVHRLNEIAKPLGVKLAVENVGYHGASIFTQDEYCAFLEPFDDNAGYLVDTGHARLNNWDIPDMIRRIGRRLNSLHLHDNSGRGDEHLPIEEGSIEWEPIYEALKEVSPDCLLILEYTPGCELEKLRVGKQLLIQKLGLS